MSLQSLRFALIASAVVRLFATSNAPTITLTSSQNPTIFGHQITLTAAVSASSATGTVTFYDGKSIVGSAPLNSGQATLKTIALNSGVRSLRAYYGGDASDAPATSAVFTQTVNVAPGSGFVAGSSFNVGSAAWIAVGDFNNDGNSDLAIDSYDGNNVTVVLGDGRGGFTPAAGSPFAVGTSPVSIVVADFNGDGNLDIATANSGSNSITELLGNGSGGFTPAAGSPFTTGQNVGNLTVADFNNDGKADLSFSANNLTVIWLGDGRGGFTPAPTSGILVGGSPFVGDFNGDGILDLAIAYFASGQIFIYAGNGTGAFTAHSYVSLPSGLGPEGIIGGDFNGDGYVDLAVPMTQNGVMIFLGDGSYNFAQAAGSPFPDGLSPAAIATGDFNADGIVDLAIANFSPGTGGGVYVLEGNGTGGFAGLSGSPFGSGHLTQAVAVADFNGDGVQDMLESTSTGIVTVLLGAPVQVGPAAQLRFTTQPSNNGAGSPLNPAPVVQIVDQNGYPVTTSTAAVTVTPNPSGTAITVNAANGAASFPGLSFSTSGTYTLTATSPGLAPVTSNSFNIVADAPTVEIDSLTSGTTLNSNVLTLSGWAIDTSALAGTGISAVNVYIDSMLAGAATYGLSRPEVCTTYPGRPGCPYVGYSYYLMSFPVGTHTITVAATDRDGTPDTGSSSVTVTLPGVMNYSKAAVFRDNVAFLADSDGNQAYTAGVDRFIPNFTGPGGFIAGDVPVVGDWTGDGSAKVGIYRASTGTWYLDANNNGVFDAGDLTYSFGGLNGDMPFVGDWSASGKSCVGIYRSNGSLWLLDLNCNGAFDNTPADAFFPFGGLPGDVPVVGAWAGGATRVGVVRKYAPAGIPQGNPFYWVPDAGAPNAGNAPVNHPPDVARCFAFGGLTGDVFVTGDWYGTGKGYAGVYRAGFWVLDAAPPGAPQADHIAGLAFGYGGLAGDIPVPGKW